MEKKYFFFDIDGTLTNQNPGGEILPSTFKTLDDLRAKGHFVSIATGRAHWQALEFSKQIGINNLITDGGNGLTIDDEVVSIVPLEKKLALEIINECVEKDIPLYVAIDNTIKLYTHSHSFDLRDCWGDYRMHDCIVAPHLVYEKIPEIHKIYVGLKREEEGQLESLKSELGFSRYSEKHLIIEPDDKYVGIKKMMKYLDAPLEDVVVFGDGRNDLTMMQQAATSIAMGNAIPELKEVATFITKNCDDDGIEYACRHFKWID